MSNRFIHFNLKSGCTSEMINASMIQLIGHADFFEHVKNTLLSKDVSIETSSEVILGIKGCAINFYYKDKIILPYHLSSIQKRTKINTECGKASFEDEVHNEIITAFINNESIPIKYIYDKLKNSPLDTRYTALMLTVLDELFVDIDLDEEIDAKDALWILCHLSLMCAAIEHLDVRFITASKVYVSEHMHKTTASILHVYSLPLITSVLKDMVAIEINDVIHTDALALAFMKSLVGEFGPRGESCIRHVGYGLAQQVRQPNEGVFSALLCEPSLPESMTAQGKLSKDIVKKVVEVKAHVPLHVDIARLCEDLEALGAFEYSSQIVMRGSRGQDYALSFLVTEHDKRAVIQKLMSKGETNSVKLNEVSYSKLRHRLISIPFGSGNKQIPKRFHEYIYYDKVLSVKPHEEDMKKYMSMNDYSYDIARKDLMAAYKKWRTRLTDK